jgi:hypothetical protein
MVSGKTVPGFSMCTKTVGRFCAPPWASADSAMAMETIEIAAVILLLATSGRLPLGDARTAGQDPHWTREDGDVA